MREAPIQNGRIDRGMRVSRQGIVSAMAEFEQWPKRDSAAVCAS
ncbi:hypothetical protein BSU04_19555 [Caballeronia sordidicola]|uniref:Uncharacterized protein n=1 Tax=Caballeronia sordidicola TaxID=196367 RepID=A0A226X1R1_CABSO|nr:hypothetical protein BSU04_19555 [Caballeronia sordidicola]